MAESPGHARQARHSHEVRREEILQAVIDVCSAEGIGIRAGCVHALPQ